MNTFVFIRPLFLYLFIPLILLFILFLFRRSKNGVWESICSPELMPYILVKRGKYQFLTKMIPFLAISLLILAVSGPSFREVEMPLFKEQSGLLLLLDLSDSMNADDVKPSRLKRALYKIQDILNRVKGASVSLVVFSEKPYVVTPFTDDVGNISLQLNAIHVDIMPSKGHRPASAIQKSLKLFKQANITDGTILLLTSELDELEAKKIVDLMKDSSIKLSVLGFGEKEKIAIAKNTGGYLRDQNGVLIQTSLKEDVLKKLSRELKGVYAKSSADEKDLDLIFHHMMESKLNQENSEINKTQIEREDVGYLIVFVVIPFVSLLFRKGVLSGNFIFCLLLMPCFLEASWVDYFQDNEKIAETHFHEGDYLKAKELFKNEDWKACSSYMIGDYEEAKRLFQKNQTADGYYNYGNALAKLEEYEEAILAYSQALEIDEAHEDARYNKELIENYLKDQKKNESSNSEENKKDDKSNDPSSSNSKDNQENDSNLKEDTPKNEDEKEDQPIEKNDSENSEDENPKDLEDQKEQNEEKENESQEQEVTENENEDHGNPLSDIDQRLLRQVKDDPSELLRRKFLQQYRKKGH